jgi:hypothetical protein
VAVGAFGVAVGTYGVFVTGLKVGVGGAGVFVAAGVGVEVATAVGLTVGVSVAVGVDDGTAVFSAPGVSSGMLSMLMTFGSSLFGVAVDVDFEDDDGVAVLLRADACRERS